MRILLVEDHDDLAAAVIDRFGWKGRAIDCEADGTEAAALLRHAEVDPVLIDVDLPGLAGAEVLRGMRARGEPTPVPLLTARPEVDDRVAGLDAGADGYVVKHKRDALPCGNDGDNVAGRCAFLQHGCVRWRRQRSG